jgi:hypothetical protein
VVRRLCESYAIARLHRSLVHRLHNAAFLVCNIADPICLSCRNDQMRAPALNVAVQFLSFIYLKLSRVLNCAGAAVVQAVVTICGGVGGGKERVTGRRIHELSRFLDFRHRKCRRCRGQAVVEVLEGCRHPVGVKRLICQIARHVFRGPGNFYNLIRSPRMRRN